MSCESFFRPASTPAMPKYGASEGPGTCDRRGHHVTKAEKGADPDAKCEMCSEEPCDCDGDLLTISQIDSWIHTGQHGAPSVNASGETEAEVAAQ